MIGLFFKKYDNFFNQVIEWLHRFGIPFICINLDDIDIGSTRISLDDNDVCIGTNENGKLKIIDLSYSFYRSGGFKFTKRSFKRSKLPKVVGNNYLRLEFNSTADFIYCKIRSKSLGYISREPLNKLEQLEEAKNHGLTIPKTEILTSRADVIQTFCHNSTVVVKAIQENIYTQLSDGIYFQRATLIAASDMPELFFPTLIQEQIEKCFEIRSCYLNSEFYSIAIFDINNDRVVDMRDNYENHINLKFDLPPDIREKLDKLMKTLRLRFGMIDLIYSKDGQFYFLEVNPQGQFDWVSNTGGYNIHKRIAEFLKAKHNEADARRSGHK